MQADHLFRGNLGAHQMPLSVGSKVTTLSVHGVNAPGSGKVVNLPANNKGAEHAVASRGQHHRLNVARSQRHDDGHHEVRARDFVNDRTNISRPATLVVQPLLQLAGPDGRHARRGGGTHLMGGGGGGFGRRH